MLFSEGVRGNPCYVSLKTAKKCVTVSGIHLEKDMSVPFGHTVARTVCLFEILCAPKSVECAFFEIVRAPNQCNEKCIN